MNPALHMPEVYYREKCDRAGYKIIKKIVSLEQKLELYFIKLTH